MRVSLRRLKEMVAKEMQSETEERKKPLVKPARGGYHVRKEVPVKGYWREDEDGTRTWVPAHEEDSVSLDET